MNHNGENELTGTGCDPVVSAEYRAVAIERTPPALDSAVLNEADAAVRASGLQRFTASWFRPLAFVASLGLALALLLEYASTDNLQWAPVRETPPVVPSDSASTTAKEEMISSEFSEMIEASSKRMREQEALRDAIILNLGEPGARDARRDAIIRKYFDARGLETNSSEIITVPRALTGMTTDVPKSCTEEITIGPWAWLQCISDLDDAGRHDEASVEMELFKEAYPDFPELQPPIPSQ